ncbi:MULTISPECIES: NADPH-dependent F420 reductase [unclassified Streptomyces]|uniref:NADPH-dependent F420 reductase n=1 Tax=unclassified Streptomyces TaxID=2593676 RepID=UPI002259A304|nr:MULTISPECIES: NAD(P)-binding domain-containing protein [unclassified Streptomyces]MCX4406062.1 NAD(P)-binding domain-containing protein [Streptomyces sp. NBC_01764]MCX5189414.1 NAD(P)-binding domain-containing protein [Streptomyces sp. NBC_00268]
MTTRYAIIGTGNIGSALAILFDRAGISVSIANTRGPDSIPEFGATVHAVTLEEALESDIIFVAIPFLAVEDLGKKLPNWDGKIVIDTTNAFYAPNAEAVLKGRLSSDFVGEVLPGAVIVKAFNQLPSKTLAAEVPSGQGKRVIFVSSNSDDAGNEVARLVAELGLAAVELGRIDEGGRLIQAPNALVLRNLVEQPFA